MSFRIAAAGQFAHVRLRGAGRGRRRGPHGFAKGGEHVGIDRIGPGLLAPGTGKMPRAQGLDDAQDFARRVQRGAGQPQDAGVPPGVVGQVLGGAAQTGLECVHGGNAICLSPDSTFLG